MCGRGLFCFDDIHGATCVVLYGVPMALHLHIALQIMKPKEEQNSIVITPERRCDMGEPFWGFMVAFDGCSSRDFVGVDVVNEEVLWRPPGCDEVAREIARSFSVWDGDDLATLPDKRVRIAFAEMLANLAEATGIREFCRNNGRPIRHEKLLL